MVVKSGQNASHGSAFHLPPRRRPERHGATSTRPTRRPSTSTSSAAPSAARSCEERTFFFFGYEGTRSDRADDRHGHHGHRGDAPRVTSRPSRRRSGTPSRGRPFPGNIIPATGSRRRRARCCHTSRCPRSAGLATNYRRRPHGPTSRENQYFGRIDHQLSPVDLALRPDRAVRMATIDTVSAESQLQELRASRRTRTTSSG